MPGTRSAIARQGTNDGLCGVYCLINAVRDHERLEDSTGEDLLRYFLEAASRLAMFVPSKISDGYEAHELVDMFNEFARCLDIPVRAQLLATVQRSMPLLSPSLVAKRIFEECGQIVIHTRDADHWYLAYSFDFERKVYLVEDSNRESEKTFLDPKRVLKLGVVLLPAESCLMGRSDPAALR